MSTTFSMDPTLTDITSLSTVLFAGTDISANAPLRLNTINLENTNHAKYQKLADVSLNWYNYGSFYKMKILQMGFDGTDLSQNLADTDSSGQIQFLAGGGSAQKGGATGVGSGTFTAGTTFTASTGQHWWQIGTNAVDISLNLRDVSNADALATPNSTNTSNVVYNEWASSGGLTSGGGLYPKSSTSVPGYVKNSTDFLTDLYMSQVTYDIFTDTQYSSLFDNESTVRTTVIEAVNNTSHAFENLGRIGASTSQYDALIATNASLMGSKHFAKDPSWCNAGTTSGSSSYEISDAQRMFALFQREKEASHDLSSRLDKRFNNIAAAVNANSSLAVTNEEIIWGGRTTIIVDASGSDAITFVAGTDISQNHGKGASGTGIVIGNFTQDASLKTVLVIDVSSGSFDLVGNITTSTASLDAGDLLAVATGPKLDYITTDDADSLTLPVGTKLTQGSSIGYVTAVTTSTALQIVVVKGTFNTTTAITSGASTPEYVLADLTSFTHNAAHGVEKIGEYWGDHLANTERDVIIYLPIEASDKIRMNSYFTVNVTSVVPHGNVVISSGNIGDGTTSGGRTSMTYDRSHLNYYVECTATASDTERTTKVS